MLRNGGSVTLLDVARAAGVSLKTASRVLNHSSELRPETEQHVRKIMAKLSYQPNELARGLKSKKSAAIALIVPDLADPFLAPAIQAVHIAARARGYVVLLACSGGDANTEKAELQAMARRQIDGILLVAAANTRSNLAIPMASKVPVVVFDEPVRGANVDTILVANRKAARTATRHLLEHGTRRILAVGSRPDLFTCAERLAGYRSAMKQNGAKTRELLVPLEADLTAEAFRPCLFSPKGANAILTLNRQCSRQVLQTLKALKMRAPEDVALIAFDDFDLAEVIPPGITSIRQPVSELGLRAAESLFERIEKTAPREPRKIVLPAEFIARGSCGCPPAH